ncbi:CHRM5 [Branchiostoma lanceolatum]|uniref:CHRM5 protein n=1 Tax=Branchiostoma lanceolatum TaxID=7740 RepID=A0A8J9YXY7_BRALA|nr:CHRM5 [Branchiostoma lanceolatum]
MALTTGNIALYVILGVLSAVTVIGNVISIVCFSKNLNISSSGDVFMLNLAVADLLIGLVSMPLTIVQEAFGGSFPLGLEVCRAWLLVDYTVCSASAFSIVLISHDRYLQIVKPHEHRVVTARKRLAMLVTSWILAFLVYGPAIVVWDVVPDICEARYQYESKEYTFVMAVVEFFVPFSVMTFLYVQVYRHAIAWRRRRTLRRPAPSVAASPERTQAIRKFNRRALPNCCRSVADETTTFHQYADDHKRRRPPNHPEMSEE